MSYNDINAHERDCRLHFDAEAHVYTCEGREFKSVTTLVEECFPQFDPQEWAPRVARREGLSAEEILARWAREGERARTLGTAMHEKIEQYYLGHDAGDDTDAYRLFRNFAASTRLYPYRTEWRIYHEDHDLAGTLDFLERTPEGTFNLWDWKRSSKLVGSDGVICSVNRYGKMGYYPLNVINDTPYWHYALQLNVYSYILEEKYGIHVHKMNLGVFHPEYVKGWVIPVPPMRDHVVTLLRARLSARVG